jgi:hypothetical protein
VATLMQQQVFGRVAVHEEDDGLVQASRPSVSLQMCSDISEDAAQDRRTRQQKVSSGQVLRKPSHRLKFEVAQDASCDATAAAIDAKDTLESHALHDAQNSVNKVHTIGDLPWYSGACTCIKKN